MERVYNLRKSNAKLCFQLDSYPEDRDSSGNSQGIEQDEYQIKRRSYLSSTQQQTSSPISAKKQHQYRKKSQEEQRTYSQTTIIPFEETNSTSFTSNNNTNNNNNIISKKQQKKQDKLFRNFETSQIKNLEKTDSRSLESKAFCLPYFNFPVNVNQLANEPEGIQSIFSSINITHYPLYAISNKSLQTVTIALRQNTNLSNSLSECSNKLNQLNSPINTSLSQKFVELNDLVNDVVRGNSQIFVKQSDPSSYGKSQQAVQNTQNTTNSKKKNKIQFKYLQSAQVSRFAENNKYFVILENVKYQNEDSSVQNQQLLIHLSYALIKILGWEINEFVEQASFLGLPEIALTKNYKHFLNNILSLILENVEHQNDKSDDTNDTSNFNQGKDNTAEVSLISCKGQVIQSQAEIALGDNGSVFFTFSKLQGEQAEEPQKKQPINKKRLLSKAEVDYLATHFFKEESLGYDPSKVCKFRFISSN